MGGIAGRCDALFGAIECQRTTGSLHLHLWAYIQRLHQFHTLEQIADKIQEGLASPGAFKAFLGNICMESYPNEAEHAATVDQMEKQWPKFSESNERSG